MSADSPAAKQHRLTSFPWDEGSLLDFYQGGHEAAFIALHPFVMIPGADPREFVKGPLIIDRSSIGSDNLLEAADRLQAERRKGKFDQDVLDALEAECGEAVGWAQVCEEIGLQDICSLDRALLTSIRGLREEFCDYAAADRVKQFCLEHRLFMPSNGDFPPILERSILSLFRRAGFSSLVIADEFDRPGHVVETSVLATARVWAEAEGFPTLLPRSLYAPDHSPVVTVHWDSFFSLICGRLDVLRSVALHDLFEGFWCGPQTTLDWWREPALPLVRTSPRS